MYAQNTSAEENVDQTSAAYTDVDLKPPIFSCLSLSLSSKLLHFTFFFFTLVILNHTFTSLSLCVYNKAEVTSS
ncbi:hypothetical protein QVD17_19006 [Tagetes erecta]|uniref:Uncharacterized protein n=1 Tax=Tagetes erecta TaxID=13708 RepID=A0AAD8KLJ0_TARER|nr:hypothetical protein QVD17_19006 [Tagetes erecta]